MREIRGHKNLGNERDNTEEPPCEAWPIRGLEYSNQSEA